MKRFIIMVCIILMSGAAGAIPLHVDLDVGQSILFDGRLVTLTYQSTDYVIVDVDGVKKVLQLSQSDCGSPRTLNFTNINGVEILPDIVSDIENHCKEENGAHRRWVRHKAGWETGDKSADYDNDDAARLVLKSPGEDLPDGFFPVGVENTCEYMGKWKSLYFLSGVSYGIHSGIDFHNSMGTPLYAVADGTITHIEKSFRSGKPCAGGDSSIEATPFYSGYTGNFVLFKDETYRYKYAHFDEVSNDLYVGKQIRAGDYLGTMGCTATISPHLHFAMFLLGGTEPHYQEYNVNPFPFLKKWACESGGCQLPVNHNDYCRDCGPCAEGQGDCDNDDECQGDLICPQKTGTDYCEEPEPDCTLPINHNDYCRDCGPCNIGEGDCDNDSECLGDLICPQHDGTDHCEKPLYDCSLLDNIGRCEMLLEFCGVE